MASSVYSIPAGVPFARATAQCLLHRLDRAALASALVLVPTRRSAARLREALLLELQGEAALLPRMVALSDSVELLPGLMEAADWSALASILPAMSTAEHRYSLMRLVLAFEQVRGRPVTHREALALADQLMALQERAIRQEVAFDVEALATLGLAPLAKHGQEALRFLSILAEAWPAHERELGKTTASAREVALLRLLAQHWQRVPVAYPVFFIGSTASQPATAALMQAVLGLPAGAVILPGLDTRMEDAPWQAIAAGHPCFHLKQWLQQVGVAREDVTMLGDEVPKSLWLRTFMPVECIAAWQPRAGEQVAPPSLKLVACAHREEELRILTLLVRETLEHPTKTIAVVTPDEAVLDQLANHLKRYGILADRLRFGTLGETSEGLFLRQLMQLIAEPTRCRHWRDVLFHPLLGMPGAAREVVEEVWRNHDQRVATTFLAQAKRALAGVAQEQLQRFVSQVKALARAKQPASDWLAALQALLVVFQPAPSCLQTVPLATALESLNAADCLGTMDVVSVAELLEDALAAPLRQQGHAAHPRVMLLTPVEARMTHADRVVLAAMQDDIWPGVTPTNPWLNQQMQLRLGLSDIREDISLSAHDLLMLGSGEVLATYALRSAEGLRVRSRFLERWLACHAALGFDEAALHTRRYHTLLQQRDAVAFSPAPPAEPKPPAALRPRRLAVTDLGSLCVDPYTLYAKYVLKLREATEPDTLPNAADFGRLAHKAAEALATHWQAQKRAANADELAQIADNALALLLGIEAMELFWRPRLLRGLQFLNQLEQERRGAGASVECEKTLEHRFALPNAESVVLEGRIDRIERVGGRTRVIDHKTGEAPRENTLFNGETPQLLAYALMLEAMGETIESVEYWSLPRGRTEGKIETTLLDAATLGRVSHDLQATLMAMLDEASAFLAKPRADSSESKAYSTLYDGISRYDEWAS
jgi:ATP-dependent helicase/nuclease subunit B